MATMNKPSSKSKGGRPPRLSLAAVLAIVAGVRRGLDFAEAARAAGIGHRRRPDGSKPAGRAMPTSRGWPRRSSKRRPITRRSGPGPRRTISNRGSRVCWGGDVGGGRGRRAVSGTAIPALQGRNREPRRPNVPEPGRSRSRKKRESIGNPSQKVSGMAFSRKAERKRNAPRPIVPKLKGPG